MKPKPLIQVLLCNRQMCLAIFKKFQAMKRFTLMIFFVLFLQHVIANAIAQGISLSVKDAPLGKVLPLIQMQTKQIIVYVDAQLAGTKKVTVEVTNEKLEKVIALILKEQPLSYSVNGEYIIIKSKSRDIQSEEQNNITGGGHPIDLTGRVTNEKGEPVVGATVMVKGTNIITTTGNDGFFSIKGVDNTATLTITSVGYEQKIVKVTSGKIEIKMIVSAQVIKEVVVKGSTGYQVIDKDHPGSFDVVDNDLLNRRISANVLDRIENLTTGLSFGTPNERTADNPSGILIRGRNSIYSNVAPLIVLDNFPYDGDINNINPNDVETITILKDAAAIAQWGAKAANGVIVISTKRGKTGKAQVSLNSNATFLQRPNLDLMPIISSSSSIEVEKWLFAKGYYDPMIDDIYSNPPLTPVQELLVKARNNEITFEEANAQIEKMKLVDVRDDLKKYFYRAGTNVQNSINVSGSTQNLNYYFSAGWDKGTSNLVGATDNRFSIRSQNTFRVSNCIQIEGGINYVNSFSKAGNNPGININPGGGKGLYPYADLVNDLGQANILVKDFRQGFIDTLGGGKLLDWKYRPYDDLKDSKNNFTINDLIVNAGIKFNIQKGWAAEVKYQFEQSTSISESINESESYFARSLVNQYYQPDAVNKFPIPVGGIAYFSTSTINSHQGRAQINYNKIFGQGLHKLSFFGGVELKSLTKKGNSSTAYGYSRKGSVVNNRINFDIPYVLFPTYYSGSVTSTIPYSQSISEQTDNFVSLYLNGLYNYKEKYFASVSARKDAANLFGVSTNQRGVPLWSAGVNWKISNEEFYKFSVLPELGMRITYGSGGNYSKLVSALTTASYRRNVFGDLAATILTPPNEKLRWEKVYTLNLGIDFATKGDRLSGSIDFYKKRNVDLLGLGPIDPTAGLTRGNGVAFYFANLASMKGSGLELRLTSRNLTGKFVWQTDFLLTNATNKVTEYLLPLSKDPITYLSGQSVYPIIGKPLFNLYGFRWEGLESETGDPQGFIDGKKSKDYYSILSKTSIDSLDYLGQVQPKSFGSLRNTFSWNGVTFSFNISYKLGYYFRRSSISYYGLYSNWTGHSDYENRWKSPGDEKKTNVPSQVYIDYPQLAQRENFYANSSALVEKADHIRFEDISLSYSLKKSLLNKTPLKGVRIYGYASNLNWILWKANNAGIDPMNVEGFRVGKSYSIGINCEF